MKGICIDQAFLKSIFQPKTQWRSRNLRHFFSSDSRGESLINSFTERTHSCGQLTPNDIGKRVDLFGWVQYTRFNNKILALRDSYGVTQCIISKDLLLKSLKSSIIPNESVIQVSGVVKERPKGKKNLKLSTGEVEVMVDGLNVISESKKDLPILTRDDPHSSQATLNNRLKYRYLDLRSLNMQEALRFRSEICKILRNKLYDLKFIECETPTLFSRTPGGAHEFIVPTQLPGKFYSLVQSPQQLKQLLMIGGLDRYFQICRCYRDETGRSDRQPEFTQLDIELSFTNQDMIMSLIDELMYDLTTKFFSKADIYESLSRSFDHNLRIERISYKQAIDKYGSDKPDARFGWLIEPCDNGLQVDIPFVMDNDQVLNIIDATNQTANLETTPELFLEVCHQKRSMILRTVERSDAAKKVLGLSRNAIAAEFDKQGIKVYECKFKFLWVTDFPLFTLDEKGYIDSSHHPFTAPTEDSIHLLKDRPLDVVGKHYDLVLNGNEVAGGSIRIHDAELQRQILAEVLRVDEKKFNYFINALKSGCPPHGGIAVGIDRLISILLCKTSIRDVIAFPKSNSGRDLLTDSPSEIDDDVRRLYHINLRPM